MSVSAIHNIGDVIGDRYAVEGYVGAGGMQEVYKATDQLLSRTVALKVPKNSSAEKRFQRSAVVSARVNHANVAKTLDYLEDGPKSYLVEEFIYGRDLSQVLKEEVGVLDPMIAAFAFHHLAKGLAASHHAGVVHRDLKPSNVMAINGGKITDVKITDFGIAKMAEEELAEAVEGGDESITASQTAIGALPYMAPEMIRSMKDAGKPADIWSLGAMLFELISGKKPFGSGLKAVPAILEAKMPSMPAILRAKTQFKPIGKEMYELIAECIRADPQNRPTADALVKMCETLCYPVTPREFGAVSKFDNRFWGFINPDLGKSIFFHIESVYGNQSLKVGDRVSFARHEGGGSDRAFPVTKLVG
jgi:eukaryotic-like serine/threonine-protein kinase